MKVFISWSGSLSGKLGEALRDWLPSVLQMVKPYFTPSDIEKGTRWANEIGKELELSEVGILCITRDNLHSEWVLFEAGALSKSLDKAYVCPILFGMRNTDLAGPLKQFQTTEFNKDDFYKLLGVINSRVADNKLPQKTLDNIFEKVDLLICPSMPFAANPKEGTPESDALEQALNITLKFTAPYDFSGNPTLSIPWNIGSKGMPLSVQLIARDFEETTLINAGYALEQAGGHFANHPTA